MKILRFYYNKKVNWGILENNIITVLKFSPFKCIKPTLQRIKYRRVKVLVPAVPTKIVLVGLNYKDHAKELNMSLPKEPIIFLKPVSSLIAHREFIVYPKTVKNLDFEAELALVIKKKAKDIRSEDVFEYILGYTCLNDVTARDLQKKDIQWTRSKSFDTFCPVGPYLETEVNPTSLKIRSYLNGKLKQNSSTSNFIFSIEYLVSFISKIMTLYPGDIISTGTPKGVGHMERKDKIEIEIENVGKLINYVR